MSSGRAAGADRVPADGVRTLGPARRAAVLAFLLFFSSPLGARAADLAALQVSVAAPDPVVAGETVSFQALAVNNGLEAWTPSTYYWEAEIYDLDRNFITKLDRIEPPNEVRPGETSSAVFFFQVPDTISGRRLFRVFLTHAGNRLIESDYRGFQILERAITPPKLPDYKVGGNVTVSYKNSSQNGWSDHNGATSANLIGKMQDSSFLFNTFILSSKSNAFNPYVLLFNYYAPWGTVSLGDVSPTFGTLALSGQGMRGAMLEQTRTAEGWTSGFVLAGGRTVASSNGSSTTNGRYQRLLYGGKATVGTPWNVKFGANYTMGFDDDGSLSADPLAVNFRGPSLRPSKNPSAGLDAAWEPGGGVKLIGEFQKSSFYADSTSTGSAVGDSAMRAEARLDRKLVSVRGWVQRTGTDFSSFGAPTAIPDRVTTEGSVTLRPKSWASLFGTVNQFHDNLSQQAGKVTTTQRVTTGGGAFQLPSATGVNLSYSLNSAIGDLAGSQDNKTGTLSAGLSQAWNGQVMGLNVQQSAFTDNTHVAHDLGTTTIGLSGSFNVAMRVTGGVGLTSSNTTDKVDGSSRKTQSLSGSVGFPITPRKLTLQLWGTRTSSTSDSPTTPADATTMTFNAELTVQRTTDVAITFGVGRNQTTDSVDPTKNVGANTASLRVSYGF